MFKKALLASGLLLASMAAQAGVISYNGYTRATDSNIVTGGGLEWLMWDVTKGLSINQAIAKHGANGWALASNMQVASLFNAFQFGRNNWFAPENSELIQYTPWDVSDTGSHDFFIELFGYTDLKTSGMFVADDPYVHTSAIYGNDPDKNGQFKNAGVNSDFVYNKETRFSNAALSSDWVDLNSGYYNKGIALVRSIPAVPTPQVPLPGSLSLLALGLVAFGVRRRQASSR